MDGAAYPAKPTLRHGNQGAEFAKVTEKRYNQNIRFSGGRHRNQIKKTCEKNRKEEIRKGKTSRQKTQSRSP